MNRKPLISLLLVVVFLVCQVGMAQAETPPQPVPIGDCQDYPYPSPENVQSIFKICMPPSTIPWNKDLVVFLHGYVPAVIPAPYLPVDQLSALGGGYLPNIINQLGYAFAMPSYPMNGLAIIPGVEDAVNIVNFFPTKQPAPRNVFLVGASEGGLVATLAVERNPRTFNGALAACGPIGSFQTQVNHFGDFRVLFDYFFPKVLPGTAVDVPLELMQNWESKYMGDIATAMALNPTNVAQLFKVAKVPVDPTGAYKTALELLWYNAFATMDAQAKLLGNPFDNKQRWYFGSSNDWLLNQSVFRRPRTASTALMQELETNGKPSTPMVTLHTTGDPVVPYIHETLYTLKTLQSGTFFKRTNIPISRYGHCNFTEKEAVFGFALMILKSTGTLPQSMISALADGGTTPILTVQEFTQMQKDLGPKEVYIPMVGK